VKQRYLKTGCLSRLLALTVAPLAWVGDIYASEPATQEMSTVGHPSKLEFLEILFTMRVFMINTTKRLVVSPNLPRPNKPKWSRGLVLKIFSE
jgi:hypothetical protein